MFPTCGTYNNEMYLPVPLAQPPPAIRATAPAQPTTSEAFDSSWGIATTPVGYGALLSLRHEWAVKRASPRKIFVLGTGKHVFIRRERAGYERNVRGNDGHRSAVERVAIG